ncbi:hypothetical protein CC86DRAFT_92648 [Ophiobolus disseminans]|uniref:Uncharacterized protein n=1 Tax=Ophiobolus disseminans TaxID=1469910 RepID=A0A6A7AIA5_9PLEO|nr:hypothetical protein CC86DRAFT_92648 [Ophiobolus disseminans]
MPAHTPSPRRFLAPNPPSTQKPKPKPQSGLRNALTLQTPKAAIPAREKAELQFKKLTPAKRFVVAPHRRTQSAEEHGRSFDEAQAIPRTHVQLTPRPKPPRKFERVEIIDEGSQSSPVAPPDDDIGFGVLPSVEHTRPFVEAQQEEENDENDEILFVTEQLNKRRRISPPTSPPSHQPSSPTTPTIPHNSTTHRFLAPPPRTPAPFSTTTSIPTTTSPPTITLHRPTFILPPQPTSPQKPSKPLPEIFSPSRKSHKYVEQGLAATMQSWIIEAANTGHAAQERSIGGVLWGREREDGVKMRLRVSSVSAGICGVEAEVECFAGHFVFVKGEVEGGMYNASRASSVAGEEGGVRVLLAGQGGARGVGGVKVRVGGVLGIKQPVWDVDVGGEGWTVGVDWVLL